MIGTYSGYGFDGVLLKVDGEIRVDGTTINFHWGGSHNLPVPVWVSSWFFGFLSKTWHQLEPGLDECVNVCVVTVIEEHLNQRIFPPHGWRSWDNLSTVWAFCLFVFCAAEEAFICLCCSNKSNFVLCILLSLCTSEFTVKRRKSPLLKKSL